MAIVFRRDYIAMALASPFQTFSLCPGHVNPGILEPDGFGETRNPVSFSEEIPIRLEGPFDFDEHENSLEDWEKFRVNLPANKILPLLWNMKEWEVAFSFSINLQEINASPNEENPQWTCSHVLTGKFMSFFFVRLVLSVTSEIQSTNLEPALKVDGLCDYHRINGGNVYTGEGSYVTTGQNRSTRLLPSVITSNEPGMQSPYYAFSSEVTDAQGNLSGIVEGSVESTKNFTEYGNSVTTSADSYGRMTVYRLFLKNDGTVDVLFNAKAHLQDYPGGFLGQLVSEASYSSPSVTLEPVTLTIFGEEVPAYFAFLSFPPYKTRTLYDFNFSYDVTVQEEWTY